MLCDNGHPDVARALLWQSEMPSWLYEVDRGATTIWETWDAISPDGEIRPMSFNHCAGQRRRLAVPPGRRHPRHSPGYRTAVVEPDFDAGVDEVHAHLGTPFGRLGVEWTRTGDVAGSAQPEAPRDARAAGGEVVGTVTVDLPYGMSAWLVVDGERVALPPGQSTHQMALGSS